jgi:hypothetical protein
MPTKKISQGELDASQILQLNLKTEPFNVMVTGENTVEYREIKPWMKSRLFDKDGISRDYDFVEFTLGYGNPKPFFVCKFEGFKEVKKMRTKYSNGLEVNFDDERWVIRLGEIVNFGNL